MAQVTVDLQELEAVVRRVVREELALIIAKKPDVFHLAPGSPLYEDMQDIVNRKVKDKVSLHTHDEVWGG